MDTNHLLAHVESAPRQTFPWGALQWLCNAERMPGALLTFGVCDLEPGQGNPRHYHPNCEEVLLALEGEGRHQIEEHWVDLKAGGLIRIPTGVRHKLINTGKTRLRCVIAFSSGTRETVFLE
ncbi:MAG: cupin domain-containing protein [Gemmataceae bacterium]